MDTLTHALSGALIAAATGHRQSEPSSLSLNRRAWVGLLAGAFPDSDYVLNAIDPLLYLNEHRGVTHSIILLPVWALLLAWLFGLLYRAGPGGWKQFYGVCALALGIHIAGDTITSFGTQIFAPFSDWKAALNTTFIIDLWFTGIILISLLIALWRRKPAIAIGGIALLSVYVLAQGASEWRALEVAKLYRTNTGLGGYSVEALPQPVSPLRWKLIVSNGSEHHTAFLDLAKNASAPLPADAGMFARLAAGYRDADALEWTVRRHLPSGPQRDFADTIWRSELLEPYRRFAAYPTFDSHEDSAQRRCAWFDDIRFGSPGSTGPFRFGLCQSKSTAEWTLNRLPRVLPGRS